MKPGINEARWMATGAVLLLGVMLLVMHFQKRENPTEQLALKARRLELVNQIRLSLAAATEAEKSAVLAITDEDSQKFADQARAGTAAAEQARRELEKLSKPGALDSFSQAFAEFQRVDQEVLELAVKNTNLKASALAFGPAMASINEMDAALARLPANDVKTLHLADNARIAAYRLLALLPPHIAEESDAKMDALETQMAEDDREVRRSLDKLAGNADVKTATASYAQFSALRTQILKLSRENTNVRSLTLSLTQKRNVTALCQDALAALQQAIQNEPVTGTAPGKAITVR
jgi:hypothetical protein